MIPTRRFSKTRTLVGFQQLAFLVCGLVFVTSSSKSSIDGINGDPKEQNVHVDVQKSKIYGPGLTPHQIVLPARYFYVNLYDYEGNELKTPVNAEGLKVKIDCDGERQVWTQVLNRKFGSFIIRYKLYQSCLQGFRIVVTYHSRHVADSPYIIQEPVHPDTCYCPRSEATEWLLENNCPNEESQQIKEDLKPFQSVEFDSVLKQTIERFHHPGSHSFCHFVIKDNQIYRKCYGQHVGFHIFPDAFLLSLTRKMYLPNMEFLINLGDWPLVDRKRVKPLLPIFSWCKSNSTADILLPTYELTEASLEGMGRVSLDMMTVQANSDVEWKNKIPKLFWRGRDSRQERLDLILLSRKHPDLFNVSLTNFFFFRDKIDLYGPKAPHVSFFKFFDYKYQLNIDGTVAAYRFPFLLGGDSVVMKTDSTYFEHFYRDLKPWTHYIPIKENLEDLVDRIQWARENDDEAHRIGQNGRKYAQENLMPLNVLCYHTQVLKAWASRLKNPIEVKQDMEHVKQPELAKPTICECTPTPRVPLSKNIDLKEEL